MSEFRVRLDKNLLDKLKEIAKKDNRSMNSLVNVLIKQRVAQDRQNVCQG